MSFRAVGSGLFSLGATVAGLFSPRGASDGGACLQLEKTKHANRARAHAERELISHTPSVIPAFVWPGFYCQLPYDGPDNGLNARHAQELRSHDATRRSPPDDTRRGPAERLAAGRLGQEGRTVSDRRVPA